MSTPAKVDVGDDTRDILGALAMGDPDLLAAGLEVRADWKARSRLDDRSYALVKLAARSNGRRRINIAASYVAVLHAIGQGQPEGDHDLGRGGHELGPADLRGDRDQHAHDVLRGAAFGYRVADLPDV